MLLDVLCRRLQQSVLCSILEMILFKGGILKGSELPGAFELPGVFDFFLAISLVATVSLSVMYPDHFLLINSVATISSVSVMYPPNIS